jgi:autotransporter adhesin
MKKHDDHFQGSGHSKFRNAPSGLRASWALGEAQGPAPAAVKPNPRKLQASAKTRAGRDVLDASGENFAVDGYKENNNASIQSGDPSRYSSMAYGVGSYSSGISTTAFGLFNSAVSDNAVAMGSLCSTGSESNYAVAVGSSVAARGRYAVALGAGSATAGADYAIAIGTSNVQSTGLYSIAIGTAAKAFADNSIAIGHTAATAHGILGAVSLGDSSMVTADRGVALGQGSLANRGTAVSIGASSGVEPIGQRQLIQLAAGTQATDAVNLGQLKSVATLIGAGVNADGSILDPNYDIDGTIYHNVGDAIDALIGLGGSDPNAVTYTDSSKTKVMLGNPNRPVEVTNVADPVMDSDAVNYRSLKSATDELRSEFSVNLKYFKVNSNGGDAAATYLDAIAIGSLAIASNDRAIAIGEHSHAFASQSVALGCCSVSKDPLTVSVGDIAIGMVRRIVNVHPGMEVFDAVNLSQLLVILEALGGGASLDPHTGAVNGPVYYLANGGVQRTVDGALKKLDEAISAGGGRNPYLAVNSTGPLPNAIDADSIAIGPSASSTTSQALAVGTSAHASADGLSNGKMPPVAIGYNSWANDWGTFSVGQRGGERTIVNVGKGEVGLNSTDAINGGQLYEWTHTFTTRANRFDARISELDAQWHEALAAMRVQIQAEIRAEIREELQVEMRAQLQTQLQLLRRQLGGAAT